MFWTLGRGLDAAHRHRTSRVEGEVRGVEMRPHTPAESTTTSQPSLYNPMSVLDSEASPPDPIAPLQQAEHNLASAHCGARVAACSSEAPGCEAENLLYESPQLVWRPRDAKPWVVVELGSAGAPALGLGPATLRSVGWRAPAARTSGSSALAFLSPSKERRQ